MTTQASFFIPPYNFTPAQMGLMYIALMTEALWECLLASDEIQEPENRLWVYLLVPLLAATGCLLYSVGASTGVYWVLPCIRLFLIGVYTNVCLLIALGYALDSYPELEDEIVRLSNFIRNVGGGALTFCIQPWINASGPRNTFIYLVVIIFVVQVT
ncbi:hypothetical protein BKA60DRAFT_473067 [Fusarium oxysporum]|nr:hypothetical protein BKA60DRAFT_473067 [Fusarium oxysporum]